MSHRKMKSGISEKKWVVDLGQSVERHTLLTPVLRYKPKKENNGFMDMIGHE